MSKTKKETPAMEGGVSRAIDFNLKKEDLMLLILEGRKENMEEEIAKIQTLSGELRKEQEEAQKVFKKKVSMLCMKTISPEAKKLAKLFSEKPDEELKMTENEEDGDEEQSFGESFKLHISHHSEGHEYVRFVSKAIGDGKGGTYVKQQLTDNIHIQLYSNMSVSLALSLYGKTYAKADPLFRNKVIRACGEYSRDFKIVEESLDLGHQREMKEYKDLLAIVKKLSQNESLLSDILAEYDLFNRNQPRAKAKMIKEVLSRDESGQALLENIMTAATGVKLLAPSK